MSRLRSRPAALLMIVLAVSAASTADAQTARSGGGASAQLMQQMQQLASERTSLQAENAKLKKDLEDMRKDRDSLKGAQQAVDRRAKSTEVSLKESLVQRESTARELTQAKEKMQQLITKFRETLQTLRDAETEQTTARQTLATRDRDLKACVDRNAALYKLNQEVLAHLENQSVWTRVAQAEPFTRIKRVQLENLADDYKSRADEQRLTPANTPAPASAQKEPPRAAQDASH